MITENQQELIDKYLRGTLTSEEKQSFEVFQQDAEFQKELDFQSNLYKTIVMDQQLQQLKKQTLAEYRQLKSVSKPITQHVNERKISRSRLLSIAAAVALVIVAGIYFWTTDTSAITIEHVAIAGPTKGENSELDNRLEQRAYDAYSQLDYNKAKQLFSDIPNPEKKEKERFYHAMTLLLLHQQEANEEDVERAVQYLEQVRRSGGNLREIAEWHLALALLIQDKEDKARVILSDIAQKDHPYSEEAQKQLERL